MNELTPRCNSGGRRGAAMVMAIALVGLFAALGAMYLRSMSLEVDRAKFALARTRARNLTVGGVYAAISELQEASASGQVVQVLTRVHTYSFETYKLHFSGERHEIGPFDGRESTATVTVRKEKAPTDIPAASPGRTSEHSDESLREGAMPEVKCYRILSEGRYIALINGAEETLGSARAEAMVLLEPSGGYRIVQWSTQPLPEPPRAESGD